MIKTIKVPNAKHANIKFPEHELAHKYLDGLQGIEIGAASHNSFGLEGSINVGLTAEMNAADYTFFERSQVQMCGEYCEIDVAADAGDLPFEDNSLDYIISSHVIEHIPGIIKVFKEWNRVLKSGGIIFSIIPLRNALPGDIGRPVTDLETFITAYKERWTVDTVPLNYEATVPGGKNGHYFVYTPKSFTELVNHCRKYYKLKWSIIDQEEIDSKVGNGFTIVMRKEE